MRRTLVCLLFLAIGSGTPLVWAQTPLRLAILAFRPPAQVLEQWQPLIDYLQARLPGQHFELLALPYSELEQVIARGETEFVLTQPAHYVRLAHRFNLPSPLATLVNSEHGRPVAAFGGVIFTRNAPGAPQDPRQILGARVAVPYRGSLGGFLAPAGVLQEAGIAWERLRLVELGMPHDRVVEAVLAGQADVGFVRTGVLEAMAAAGRLDLNQIRLINPQSVPGFPFLLSTRLYPEWALLALPQVPDEVARSIAAALYDLPHAGAIAQDIGIYGFTFPADYRTVEYLMRSLRAPPFDTLPEFTARDIWRRYWWLIVPLLSGAIVITVLLLWQLRTSQRLSAANAALVQASAQLNAEHERLTQVIAAAQVGTWEWQIASDEVLFNDRWPELLGYRLDELAPTRLETWRHLVHPEDLPECERRLQRHLAGETASYDCEHRLRHKDGHWVWALTRGRVSARDAAGRPLTMFCIHLDISHRKAAEEQLARAARFHEQLLGALNEAIYGVDPEGRCTFCNPAAERLLGFSKDEIVGADNHALFHHHDEEGQPYPVENCPIWHTLRDGVARKGETWFWRRDGTGLPVRYSVALFTDGDMPLGAVVAFDDISTERALKARDRLLTTAIEEAPVAILITCPDATILWVNDAFCRLSGYRREEAVGRKPGELVKAGVQSSAFYAALWETILSGQNWRGELVNRRRDGSIYHEEMLIAPVKDEKGRITQFVAIKQDITARKRLEEELRRQASYDTLTGLSNRRHFLEQLEREQARLQRNGGEAAVLMLDLDRFKQINDTYGHAAGDEVLRAFALIVRDSLRRTDLAGRLGGEEFAILLPDTGLEQAHAFAERIRARVAGAAIATGNATLQVTVSIGISALEATETRIETALARADAALYRAKRAGGNCIVLSDPHPLIGERSNASTD